MKCNMGKTDRVLRAIIGLIVITAGVYFKSWWGAIGAVPLLTALAGWCPMYVPIGISTRKDKK